jgi:hypothetical protein
MPKVVKTFIGDAGAGFDDSTGEDNIYDVVVAMANQLNALTAQVNQLLADHNSATRPSTATTVASGISVE